MPALDYDYEYLANYRPQTKHNNGIEAYRKRQSQKESAYKRTSTKTREQVIRFMQESSLETRPMPRNRKSIKTIANEARFPNELRIEEPEVEAKKEVKKELKKELNRDANKDKLLSAKNIPLFLLIASIALFICYRYSMINEKFNKVEKYKKELLNAQTINEQLQADIDSETDISYVENYAKFQLGMQKPQDSQIVYLDVDKEDKIFTLVNLEKEDQGSWINKLMQKIAEIF